MRKLTQTYKKELSILATKLARLHKENIKSLVLSPPGTKKKHCPDIDLS